jgi:F/Y-rich N-terminus
MSGSDSDSDLQDSHPTSFEAEDAPSVSVVEDTMDDDGDDDEEEAQVMAAVVVDDEEPEAVAAAVGTPVKKNKKKRKSNEISGDNFVAAQAARLMLLQSVHRLPLSISESHTVRSFGRLRVEKQEDGPQFSSTSALYPVGFSCDRFEFSPVHGRILKLRCTILDGHQLQAKQRELNLPINPSKGPIFRIMWGEGIDEDSESFEYPYDPGTNSTCITYNGNSKKTDPNLYPEEGMRARVRYEHDQWYTGTILECIAAGSSDDTGIMSYEMRIAYDDGSEEQVSYPDPDISLHLPGTCFRLTK